MKKRSLNIKIKKRWDSNRKAIYKNNEQYRYYKNKGINKKNIKNKKSKENRVNQKSQQISDKKTKNKQGKKQK